MLTEILAQDEKIEIVTAGGHKIILDDEADSITIVTRNGASKIELNDSRYATSMECHELKVRANGSIKIQANNMIDMRSLANFNINSQGTLDMRAGSMVSIQGSIVKIN